MKRIIRLGPGSWLQLDSHFRSCKTRAVNLITFLFFTLITAVSIGGLIGVDITNPNSTQTNGQPGSRHRSY